MIFGKIKKRLRILIIIMGCFFIAIIGKLVYIQCYSHTTLQNQAETLWQRSFPVEGNRGNIFDSDGNVLAANQSTVSLIAVPLQIDNKEECAALLSELFHEPFDDILCNIKKNVSMVRLARHIDEEVVERLMQLNYPGLYLIKDSKRYYPKGHCLSQVLGFTGIDNQGLVGIELIYDDLLRSNPGSLSYYMDAKGGLLASLPTLYKAPTSGCDLVLTIDGDVQEVVDRELENAYLQYQPDAIWALAMDPNTGAILGMSSKPDYNPNHYQDYESPLYNQNIPVFRSYEPGSVFKILTFAAGLNEQLFDMDEDYYNDIGYEMVLGTKIKSWKVGGHGYQSFREVLQNSSNPGFVEISKRMSKDCLYSYIQNFGLTQKTGIDLPGENQGMMFAYDDFNPLERATVCFGQGISVTSIQLVRAVCACVNGGYLYQPYIVSKVIDPLTKDSLYEAEKTCVNQVISEETSMQMRDALETVVSDGGGKNAYIDGYRIGGKTGTAQKVVDGGYVDGQYILSFIGIAPIDDPQIVLYIAMDHPKNCVQYGGTTVAPIAKKIFEEVLPNMGIKKVSQQREKVKTWMDIPTFVVDNYIGKSKKEITSSYFHFVFKGEGDVVVSQYPKAGEKLTQDSTIMLQLGGNKNES